TTANQREPAVGVGAAGDFVIAWESHFEQEGSGYGVYAQRYSAAGAPQGGEFRVNTFTAGQQTVPVVALDAEGDAVIAWQSDGQEGAGYGVYTRQFSSGGAPLGPEFRVNTFSTGDQASPCVAADARGDLVVAWDSA